jgi:hypothetical protein
LLIETISAQKIKTNIMFKDRLNDSKFKQKTGKNYRTPKKMDLKALSQKLFLKGYKVLEIDQIFRNVHAKVKIGKSIFFLKFATTSEISERLKNEINWNISMTTVIKDHKLNFFSVPRIFDFGEIEGNSYYLSEYCENKFIAYKNPARILTLKKQIPNIVNANIFLLGLPNITFIRDYAELDNIEPFKFFYSQDLKLCEDLSEYSLEPILKIEKEAFGLKKTCVTHGDFVPWHMFDMGNKFLLIDGEHGCSKMPFFYDVAYFYHRVFTAVESPAIANLYIKKIYDKIPFKMKTKFRNYFMANLSNRLISGFWHAKNEKRNIFYHNMLKKIILDKTILWK